MYYVVCGADDSTDPTLCMTSAEYMKWSELAIWDSEINDSQKYYEIRPLHLYENTKIQSPLDVNDFVRHRVDEIVRSVD